MKATGLTRRVDTLGRVIIPKLLRNTHNIQINDPIQIFVEKDKIILRKYHQICTFCGDEADSSRLKTFKGKAYCESCLEQLNEIFDASQSRVVSALE